MARRCSARAPPSLFLLPCYRVRTPQRAAQVRALKWSSPASPSVSPLHFSSPAMSDEESVEGETTVPAAVPAGGLASATDGGSKTTISAVKRAAAARVKYAIHPDGNRVCIPPCR